MLTVTTIDGATTSFDTDNYEVVDGGLYVFRTVDMFQGVENAACIAGFAPGAWLQFHQTTMEADGETGS